ncbi:hypothetical protein [Prosthecobacter sp.]|uniref:hypothetical protein n=1 Tax=Prosthecobacter sp. TaxID=1965333 RepID=UPI003784FD89
MWSEQLNGLKRVHNVASLLPGPAKETRKEPAKPAPRSRENAQGLKVSLACDGKRKVETNPGVTHSLWCVAWRSADDANVHDV